jgi:hypothetical protein
MSLIDILLLVLGLAAVGGGWFVASTDRGAQDSVSLIKSFSRP